jgi:L-alanine-DL-glutamate epimerase-like enolase superfamily enzyme
MLEEFSLGWIEEPVLFTNHAGEAQVAAALDTPIASGESEFGLQGMLEMIKLGSADILMPDLQRIGGATEFYKVASLAEAHNVPVSSHLFTFMSLSLMATIPNGLWLEYMPWFDALYDHPLELDGSGAVVVPTRPGWGFDFEPSAVSRLRAD